ncbi:MAG TPA: hypothetical protein VNW47_03690 [Terriglobales bacterium]|jgi:hypothetical protein|nr:hypothetical protein [Terriglobales bacterium]
MPLVVCSALCAQTVTTFDVPGAADTFAESMNTGGQITGYYRDHVTFQAHGFFRDGNGVLVTFDVPDSIYTHPLGINSESQITGTYQDAALIVHGFLRQPDGTIVSIDGPGATETDARAISPGGLITGYFYDDSGIHGFLRKRNGTMISFDAPGTFFITYPQAINRKGQITGWNFDQPGASGRGFVREVDGTFTRAFDPETYPDSINAYGEVAGYIGDNFSRGLLSQPDGEEIFFDVVNSPISATPTAIDHSGRIAGWYYDPNTNCVCGFLRKRDGSFDTFTASIAASQTIPTTMTGRQIAGYYDDEAGTHGFVRDIRGGDTVSHRF